MRYKNAQIRKDKNGVRFFRPTVVPNIPIKDSDIFVYPVFGDRFDTLAQRYYEDSNLWWIIAKANELSRGNIAPDPTKKIRIPTVIDDILEAVQQSNS
jgi:hypothetical protein|tara:strand:- start:1513 stop:1806 length:294 start_codon:yes stop_codon:yes gene_type:complete